MQDWQKRVIEERDELRGKCKKLFEFIDSEKFQKLSFRNRELLRKQLEYMTMYSSTLGHRIALFNEGS